MLRFLALRTLRLLGTLFVVSLLTFGLTLALPGSPIDAILGPQGQRTPEIIARLTEEFSLDKPWYVRYWDWLGNVLQGDLGRSYISDQEVTEIILDRLPVTAELAIMAILMALIVAVPAGIYGAYRANGTGDKISSAIFQVFLSLPSFIAGILFIAVLAVRLGWFPAGTWNRISTEGVWANLQTAFLPALALSLTQMAIFARILRSDMIATLQENYILSARAKGLRDRYILIRHALRPSSLSLLTVVAINTGALLGGTVVMEFLFAIPGLGGRLLNAIFQRDVIVIQGIVMVVATIYVVLNALVDVLYAIVDPRIRK